MGLPEEQSPPDSGRQTPAPGQWFAGAKALAAFQADNTGVAKGGKVTGGPRSGSKYATLTDILAIASKGAKHGLSHTGQARMLGEGFLVYREYLHHESGECIYSEHPVFIPTAGHSGQRQQEMGGGITYARKYCIQELYGLYADDGMDPDADSYEDSKPAHKPVAKPVATPKQQSAPVPVAPPAKVEPTTGNGVASNDLNKPISNPSRDNALRIVKADPKAKAAFMAKFYPSKSKLIAADINTMEHAEFLEQHELSNAPF